MYIPGFAGRSSSLGSSSVSRSHSSSLRHVSNSQAQTFQQGSSNPYTFNGRNMAPELHDWLIEELGINILFTDRTKTGIRICWRRYKEIT